MRDNGEALGCGGFGSWICGLVLVGGGKPGLCGVSALVQADGGSGCLLSCDARCFDGLEMASRS